MAESLCGNKAIEFSVSGKPYNDPCGFWGCSYENYQDWVETLRVRIEIGKRFYKKLEELSTLNEQGSLKDTEKLLLSNLNDNKTIYEEFKAVGTGLSAAEYKSKINELLPYISDTACIIQNIQTAIDERDGTYVNSGLIKSTTDATTSSTAIKWLLIGFAGFLAFRIADRMTS